MSELWRRILYLVNRRRLDAELEGDMEFHREMAARAGRSNFGNTLRMREQSREAWGWTWLDRLAQDLALWRAHPRPRARIHPDGRARPGHRHRRQRLRLQPLQHGRSEAAARPRSREQFVRLERRSPNAYTSEMAYPSFAFYQQHARTLSAAMAVLGVPPMQIDEDLQPASASFVTPNYFTELGTPAAYGRLFDPSRDASPTAAPGRHPQLRTLAAALRRRSLRHRPHHSPQQASPPPSLASHPIPSPASAVSIQTSGCRWRSNPTSSKAASSSPTGPTPAFACGAASHRASARKPPSRSCAP